MKTVDPPLPLRGVTPFAFGGRRVCYEHPRDPGLCVKINRTDAGRTRRTKAGLLLPAAWRREYDNNADELRQLARLFRRIGPDAARHLPRCYGMVETDLGPGLVTDLVRDADGRVARNLLELILEGHGPEAFRDAFEEFGRFLTSHAVLTRSLLDHNVSAARREDGTWRLVLIDGFGDRGWLPLAEWVRPLGVRKVRRRLDEAWTRYEARWREGRVPTHLRNSSVCGPEGLAEVAALQDAA